MQLFLINKNNQTLDLLRNRDRFILTAAEGLHGIETDIAETETPYTDGANIESVRALPRGIELTFTLRGDIAKSIEFFTGIVKSKQFVTLREIEGERDITIKGVATVPPYSRMLQTCKITLSLYCGQPYWETLDYIIETISQNIALLNFPVAGQFFPTGGKPFGALDLTLTKSFTNKGDTAVGMRLSIVALGEVVNPRISCDTGEQKGAFMQVNLTLRENDELIINTVKGDKYITINGAETYNGETIINALEWSGADWLYLETGENTFSVTTEGGASNAYVYFTLTYKGRYE